MIPDIGKHTVKTVRKGFVSWRIQISVPHTSEEIGYKYTVHTYGLNI